MKYSWNQFLQEKEATVTGIVVCINDKQQFLILRRSNIDHREGQWTIPGGHIDEEDTSIEEGAVRELKEETDLACKVEDLTFLGEPKPQKYYFLTQIWKGSVDVAIPNPKTNEIEHDDWKWATIEEIKDIENSEIPIYLLENALEMAKNAK